MQLKLTKPPPTSDSATLTPNPFARLAAGLLPAGAAGGGLKRPAATDNGPPGKRVAGGDGTIDNRTRIFVRNLSYAFLNCTHIPHNILCWLTLVCVPVGFRSQKTRLANSSAQLAQFQASACWSATMAAREAWV
eukprot:SAG31_NODE_17151_length_681_cov_1.285223_1_plen_133_part_10